MSEGEVMEKLKVMSTYKGEYIVAQNARFH